MITGQRTVFERFFDNNWKNGILNNMFGESAGITTGGRLESIVIVA